MHIIILSDIFGHTEALDRLADDIKQGLNALHVSASLSILSPYKNTFKDRLPTFNNETEAYEYFTDNSSLEDYSQLLATHIDKLIQTDTAQMPISIIGFSIGASALWALAGTEPGQRFSQLKRHEISGVGYYSSQIRKMTHLVPSFPLEFVFPNQEPHFSVSEVINQINLSPTVTCRTIQGEHGFMNQHSDNFDSELLNQESAWLIDWLGKKGNKVNNEQT